MEKEGGEMCNGIAAHWLTRFGRLDTHSHTGRWTVTDGETKMFLLQGLRSNDTITGVYALLLALLVYV